MQTRRSYVLEHVQDGYVVARPPGPAGVTLPTDEELRPSDQRPQPEWCGGRLPLTPAPTAGGGRDLLAP
eukprot:4038580-Alexandrium_andersonii.AAC.1